MANDYTWTRLLRVASFWGITVARNSPGDGKTRYRLAPPTFTAVKSGKLSRKLKSAGESDYHGMSTSHPFALGISEAWRVLEGMKSVLEEMARLGLYTPPGNSAKPTDAIGGW